MIDPLFSNWSFAKPALVSPILGEQRRDASRRAGVARIVTPTLKLDSVPAGAQRRARLVVSANGSVLALSYALSRLPAGISNLAVRDKEVAIFKADFALKGVPGSTLDVLFRDETRRQRFSICGNKYAIAAEDESWLLSLLLCRVPIRPRRVFYPIRGIPLPLYFQCVKRCF